MKPLRILFLPLAAAMAFGQNYPNIPGQFSPVTLADEFFNHNYVNFFAFGTGTYDTNTPTLQNGQSTSAGGFGYAVGGGVSGYHSFRTGAISFAYSGDYRNSSSLFFTSGTDENLSIAITKRLSRRWNFSISGSAGVIFYGSAFIQPTSIDPGIIQSNPFSSESRFVATGLNFTYQQSRRLSYFVGGSYYLQRYNFPGSIGASGGSVSGGLNYRLTSRLTVGASYAHNDFVYQHAAGETLVDSFYGSITYQLPSHWSISGSGGASHTQVSGTVALPVSLIVDGQPVGGYVLGAYSQKSNLPSFNGSVSKSWRRSGFSVGAGQGVISGNGFYLAARNQYVGGSYSYSWRRANLSAGGNYYRLKSVANDVSTVFANTSFSASYGYQLYRHLASNLRYEYVRYSNLAPYPAVSDNRLSFGVSFSSKSIPLTLY